MSEATTPATGFDALKGMGTQAETVVHERKVDAQGRAYATGKRKNAVARVWLKPGKGKITIYGGDNPKGKEGRDQTVYFARPVLRMMLAQPFQVTDREGQFDVDITVSTYEHAPKQQKGKEEGGGAATEDRKSVV